jgi:hypothetical protein
VEGRVGAITIATHMSPLTWQPRSGGLFADLSDGPDGAGTYLAVIPHTEPEYFRPVCVLVPGEEERELGDGVLGLEPAREAVVKYAIQSLAHAHGLSAAPQEADAGDGWPQRTIARLWEFLAASSPRPLPEREPD